MKNDIDQVEVLIDKYILSFKSCLNRIGCMVLIGLLLFFLGYFIFCVVLG